jgi:deoxyadenosine/deoxycytidine kinase
MQATLILEDLDGNEFLSDFYGDKERWSLGMQLSFLNSRYEQLRAAVPSRTRPVVADYTYAKDGIFARNLLRGRELRLYKKISSSLAVNVAQPDVVVYLDAENDVLLDRIRRRNRSYETSVDGQYRSGSPRHPFSLNDEYGLGVLWRLVTSTHPSLYQ